MIFRCKDTTGLLTKFIIAMEFCRIGPNVNKIRIGAEGSALPRRCTGGSGHRLLHPRFI